MLITLRRRMESFHMVLLLIAYINGGLGASSESNAQVNVKAHYMPTAVSYVSFIKHIVPKRVEHSMELPKLSTRAPIRTPYGPIRTEQLGMEFVPPMGPMLSPHYSQGKTKVQREHSMSYHKTVMRPTASSYRPIYPTGYAEPIYVQSRIPLSSSRYVSGNREGSNPMVIGVQQPAYVKKYLQIAGAYHLGAYRKTLTYAPKLAYVPHNYQRV